MEIVDFKFQHIEKALKLIKEGYERERDGFFLPSVDKVFSQSGVDGISRELEFFASKNLGTVAVEGDELLGFVCAYPPFKGCYNSTTESGVWAPVHAHGMKNPLDRKTWSYIVTAAMKKWKDLGATYHSITLYSYEKELQQVLSDLCYGRRCEDAFRSLSVIEVRGMEGITVRRTLPDDLGALRALRKELVNHLRSSPVFMIISDENYENTCREKEEDKDIVTLGLFDEETLIGFMDLHKDGENFISSRDDFLNIHGMFIQGKYRGHNLGNLLVAAGIIEAKGMGYEYLGVDYETMNPTAKNFWRKNFNPYTVSMVRRLDT